MSGWHLTTSHVRVILDLERVVLGSNVFLSVVVTESVSDLALWGEGGWKNGVVLELNGGDVVGIVVSVIKLVMSVVIGLIGWD